MINNSEKILKIIDDLQGDDRLIASPKVCYGIMEIREIIEASNSEKPNSSEPKQADPVFMDDTISRKTAIDALDRRFDSIPMEQTTEICLLRKDLRELPSAQLERKTGKWIDCGWSIRCSECDYSMPWAVRNYCPRCGAKMLGEVKAYDTD